MFNNKRFLKAFALLLTVILLIGIMPTTMRAAQPMPDERRLLSEDSFTGRFDEYTGRYTDGHVEKRADEFSDKYDYRYADGLADRYADEYAGNLAQRYADGLADRNADEHIATYGQVDGHADVYSMKSYDSSGLNYTMSFTDASTQGKNIVTNAQTNEILVLDKIKPEQEQKSENQASFSDSVALLFEQFDTQDFFSTISLTADDPTMVKDGEVVDVVEYEQAAPVIEGGVFMVPLAVLVENANAESDFIYNEQSISITHEAEEIEISLEDGVLNDGHSRRRMRRNPSIRKGQIYVPLEDVADVLGYTVDQTNDTVVLSRPFQTRRLIVKALSEIDTFDAVAAVRSPDNLYVLQYETEAEAKEALQKLNNRDNVVFAGPDKFVKATSQEPLSWGVTRMNARPYQAFLTETIIPLPQIVVGVLDTGIDPNHPFFAGRIIPNDVDYTSNLDSSFDGYFHGTHVSGTIVDATPPNVKIQPYKVLDDYGGGSELSVYLGIIAAADNGVDVINMSLGGYGISELINSAVIYALELNVSVVVAAGNNGDDVTRYFPASIEEAITVAAVDIDDQWASFSNWGESIDLAAAGVDVLSAVPGNDYKAYSGTSMASPHVAAAAAMLKTYNKTLAPDHIEAILRNSTDDAGEPGWDDFFGDGILNLDKLEVLDVTAPPVFSKAQGWYKESFELTLTSATSGARIYYTTDGSAPNESSRLYTGPITVTDSGRVRARAFSNGRLSSTIVTRLYHISPFPATLHYTSMSYSNFRWHYQDDNADTLALKITFDERTDFASDDWDIFFMYMGLTLTDGNDMVVPSAASGMWLHSSSELAGNSFYVQGNSFTIEFRGNVDRSTFGFSISNVEAITIPMANQPLFDLDENVFYEPSKSIKLTSPTPNTRIYYTTDNSIPTQNSTLYTDGITISQPTVIKAIAVGQDMAPSYIANKTYYVSLYPESLHNSHSMDLYMLFPTWECPGDPDYLKVTFNENCDFGSDGIDASDGWIFRMIGDNGCGFIEIYDSYMEKVFNDYDDSEYYTEKQLAGRTIIIPGNKLNIWHFAWVTRNTYGFKIDNIEPIYGERAQAPAFSVAPGFYDAPQIVSLTSNGGASIYYTTDGSMPTAASKLYTSPINVLKHQTIRAVAIKDGCLDSRMIKGSYYISKFPESQHDMRFTTFISINDTWTYEYPDKTASALDIHFNVKSDIPIYIEDEDGNELFFGWGDSFAGKTIRIPKTKFRIIVSLATFAFGDIEENSLSYYGFKIDNITSIGGAITATPHNGVYDSPQVVTLSSWYPQIFYTLDGSVPTNTSARYNGPISISENTMLKAVGYDGSRYTAIFDGTYYVKLPPESVHYVSGWYDASWEYEYDETTLIEIVFDEQTKESDLLIYTNKYGNLFDNIPLQINRNQDGQKSIRIFSDYVNIQYLGGFSDGSDFGFKINKLSEMNSDITDAFTDPAFRAAVLEALGNPGGKIYEHKAAQIWFLSVYLSDVESLAGIEYLFNLRFLDCGYNKLTSIDLSKNTYLEFIYCDENLLTSLDLANNTQLKYLHCSYNKLTSIDISKSTALEYFYCMDNLLTSLNVTNNDSLRYLDCRLNYLPNKAAIAGLNESRTILQFDPQYAPGDEAIITIPDANFKRALINQGVDKNGDGAISIAEAKSVRHLWLAFNEISNLSGIEYFLTLRELDCSYNELATIDVSKNTDLAYFYCTGNLLTSLDVSKNNELSSLYCDNNSITSLDVSKNTDLRALYCNGNSLTSLDVSKNTALEYLYCYDNKLLTSLDLSKNTKLIELNCGTNSLSSLDLSKNTELRYILCDDNMLTSLDLPKNTELRELNCGTNSLSSLDLSKNTELRYLFCYDNMLTSLDLTKNTDLWCIDCSNNQLAGTLNLSSLYTLSYLMCYNNKLNGLILSPTSFTDYWSFIDISYNNMTDTSAVTGQSIRWDGDYFIFLPQNPPLPKTVLVGTQKGTLTAGKTGSVTFDVTTENIERGSSIKLNGVPSGVTLGTTVTAGDKTTITISAAASVGASSYSLTLTIDGITSNVFTLKVDPAQEPYIPFSGGGGGGRDDTQVEDTTEEVEEPGLPLAPKPSFAQFIEGYPDDTFKGSNVIVKEEFITILFRLNHSNLDEHPAANADNPSFNDVAAGRWSYDAIEWAADAGIIEADANGNFMPKSDLTRAEMAIMLARAEGWTDISDNIFSDIDGHPAYDDILKAVAAGIFRGYEDGTFRPDNTATRYEMVTALVRYMLGGEPSDDMWENIDIKLTDTPRTHWAFKYLALATAGLKLEIAAD